MSVDEAFKRPFPEAVPDHAEIRNDAAAFLKTGAITIRPGRRIALVLVGALKGSAVTDLVLVFGLLVGLGQGVFGSPWTYLLSVGLVPVVWVGALIYRYRGGTCTLTLRGVEFRRGRWVVFAPWSLFDTSGELARVHDGLAVPIRPSAVPLVELWESPPGQSTHQFSEEVPVRARGKVWTQQLRFTWAGEHVVLKDLYEVKLELLAQLLLHVGRQLGTDRHQ